MFAFLHHMAATVAAGLFNRVDVAGVTRALRTVEGLPLHDVESVLVEQGHVLVTLQIDPAQAGTMNPIAKRTEAAVSGVRGVRSARVILTAERAADPRAASLPAAPPPSGGHTAIRLNGADAKSERPLIPQVTHVIAVASGKGGVGKSTVAVNLSIALQRQGLSVGLLDADIYGPSIPTMLGIAGQKPEQVAGDDGDYLLPLPAHGLSVMSMGNLVGGDAPMIWRGPMVQSAILQMLRDVRWGALDILVLDMPPGTGDAQLTVAQKVPLKGAVIVSTPQDIAWLDAVKGISMFRKVGVPILGLVENMAQFCCPQCGTVTALFGPGQAMAKAAELDIASFGLIPLDPDLQQSADRGVPISVSHPDHPIANSFESVAKAIIETLS